MRAKIINLCLTFVFLQKQKKKIWEWEMITMCKKKLKRQPKRK